MSDNDDVRETRTFSERDRKPVEGVAQSGAMEEKIRVYLKCVCNI